MMNRLAATPLKAEVFAERRISTRTFQSAKFDAPHQTVNEFITETRIKPMMSIRTADCSLVAASFGIDYRWALLDRQLIQQYLRTPTVWKFGEGFGRYLHRRAITGIVPDEVAWKRSKDMGRRLSTPDGGGAAVGTPADSARGNLTNVDALWTYLPAQLRDLLDIQRLTTLVSSRGTEYELPANRRFLVKVGILADWLDSRHRG